MHKLVRNEAPRLTPLVFAAGPPADGLVEEIGRAAQRLVDAPPRRPPPRAATAAVVVGDAVVVAGVARAPHVSDGDLRNRDGQQERREARALLRVVDAQVLAPHADEACVRREYFPRAQRDRRARLVGVERPRLERDDVRVRLGVVPRDLAEHELPLLEDAAELAERADDDAVVQLARSRRPAAPRGPPSRGRARAAAAAALLRGLLTLGLELLVGVGDRRVHARGVGRARERDDVRLGERELDDRANGECRVVVVVGFERVAAADAAADAAQQIPERAPLRDAAAARRARHHAHRAPGPRPLHQAATAAAVAARAAAALDSDVPERAREQNLRDRLLAPPRALVACARSRGGVRARTRRAPRLEHSERGAKLESAHDGRALLFRVAAKVDDARAGDCFGGDIPAREQRRAGAACAPSTAVRERV